eukprot:TRINITY_DN2608_c0_g1_i15.p1 TRINITY_DN2608_c0_g1~~TRINITY_DN2608_c0_g1_i15.p1  ORF type:complete len:306 (+),score=79.56 TRINITY_DN2608_c0_g1_i15:125-1042(+)
MNILILAFFLANIIWSCLYDTRYLVIYASIVGVYTVIHYLIPSGIYNGSRRRIRIATWGDPSEPNCLTFFEVDLTKMDNYIESEKKMNPDAPVLTHTHIIIKAIANSIAANPDINGRITFGKFLPYEHADIACLIDIAGKDLGAVTIEKADTMTIKEIAAYLNDLAKKTKKNENKEHKKRVGPLALLPPYVISVILEVISFLAVNLGLNIPALGVKRGGLGTSVITNVEKFGLHHGTAPLLGFAKLNSVVTICAPLEKPVVVDGKIEIRKILPVNIIFDHRYADGSASARLRSKLFEVIENPEKF